MPFFDFFKEENTQQPAKLDKPLFYKADSDAGNQLELLKEFFKTAPANIKQQVEQDIKILAYGIAGEEQVAFELNNSYLPMLVLHDLYFEYESLSAQIDYMIITRKLIYILECKNLIGNIVVTDKGDFIRTLEFNGRYRKEGIYSPLTQNARHLEMIKRIRLLSKNNILTKTLFEKNFYNKYKSIVVLANPKTIINLKYAKKEVKEQIIRCDQLIDYIKRNNDQDDSFPNNDSEMYKLADFFLGFHVPKTIDYTKKYSAGDDPVETDKSDPVKADVLKENAADYRPDIKNVNIEATPLYKELRHYRYEKSKAEDVKPYYIYTNDQLENLISAMPETLADIKKISGFGEVKCQKYGNDILEIVKKHRRTGKDST